MFKYKWEEPKEGFKIRWNMGVSVKPQAASYIYSIGKHIWDSDTSKIKSKRIATPPKFVFKNKIIQAIQDMPLLDMAQFVIGKPIPKYLKDQLEIFEKADPDTLRMVRAIKKFG